MKIKCEIESRIFPIDDPEYKPFNVPIWMAHSFENNCKFHVKYRMVIVRTWDNGRFFERIYYGHWWKRPAKQEILKLSYAGVTFLYNQKTKEISILQDNIEI